MQASLMWFYLGKSGQQMIVLELIFDVRSVLSDCVQRSLVLVNLNVMQDTVNVQTFVVTIFPLVKFSKG